jgi:hypothetical protein
MDRKWEFQYTFYNRYVELQVLSTPKAERNYWVLYEGIPGGRYDPENSVWGTDNGLQTTKPDYLKGEEVYGFWKWVFFGHPDNNQTLFIVQKRNDNLKDTFGYLGNSEKGLKAADGMIVFGFGRDKKATPLLNRNNIFYIGFYKNQVTEQNFSTFKKYIQETFNK